MDEEQEFVLFEQEQWNKLDLLTACKFHQPYDNRLGFATKEGTINYVDMRQTSTPLLMVDSTEPAIILTPKKPEQFLKRYLNSVSDFFFLDEHTVVSRDYLSVKVHFNPIVDLGSESSIIFHEALQRLSLLEPRHL